MTDTTLTVYGSDEFVSQCQSALTLFKSVDSQCGDIISSIHDIYEHEDRFRVVCDPDRNIWVSRRVAFWPGVEDEELQKKILASYFAHECVHSYMRAKGSDEWNKWHGEDLAIAFQMKIATSLGVGSEYVLTPDETLNGVPFGDIVNPRPHLDIDDDTVLISILGGLSLIGGVIGMLARKHRKSGQYVFADR